MDESSETMPTKHSTRRAGKIVLLVAASCAAAWTFWLLLHRDNLLLSRATSYPVASQRLPSSSYWWLNDKEVVEPVNRVAIDSHTGRVRILPGFRADRERLRVYSVMIAGGSGVGPPQVQDIIPSPDGTSVAWETAGDAYTVTAIEKGPSIRLKTPLGAGVWVWLPDGLRLAWIRSDSVPVSVEVHSLTAAGPIQTLQLDGPITTWRACATEDGRIMAVDRSNVQELYDEVELNVFPIASPKASIKRVTLHLPIHAEITDLYFSPTGDRLLWQVERESHPPGPRIVRGLLRRLGWKNRKTWELWVSTTEGKDFRQVGIVPKDGKARLPYSIRWLPDGKKISFLVGKTLYTVPVD